MKPKELIVNFGYWSAWNVAGKLPDQVIRRLFSLIAIILWRTKSKGVLQLELNLSRALKLDPQSAQIRDLSRKNITNYFRYYAEIFLLPKWNSAQILQKVEVRNTDPVFKSVEKGGVVLVLPHSGNWDLAGAWAAKTFGSLCTVAERLKPEGVYRKFLKMRTEKGLTLLPLAGDGNPYEFLKDHLISGMPIALLGDRDVSGSGMLVDFFGAQAKLPIGPAMLALDTKSPIFTCSTWYENEKLIIEFDDEIVYEFESLSGRQLIKAAQDLTGKVAKRFERHINNHPEAWHQLQPIWSDLKIQKRNDEQ